MARNLEAILNKAMPSNAEARLGTRIKDLTNQVNALTAAVARLYGVNTLVTAAPTLAIKAASGVLVKSTTAFSAVVAGSIQAKTADTDMSALSGVVADTKSALFIFYMSSAGTITTVKTADAATPAAALLLLPAPTANLVRLGYILVTNASGGAFTGNATALDAEGITTTYYSTPAAPAFAATALETL